jgi:hypothetical protein
VTLEMPFKDNANNLGGPGSAATFQGPRAAALGASLLDALAHVAPSLRGVAAPVFGPDDEYVAPIEDESTVAAFVAEQYALLASETANVEGEGGANGHANGHAIDEPPTKKRR